MYRKLLEACEYNTALDASPAAVTSQPETDADDGIGVVPVRGHKTAMFMFAVNADGKTASYQVSSVRRVCNANGQIVAYLKRVVAAGGLTGGTQTLISAIGTATDVFVDTITETSGPAGARSPLARSFSDVDDHVAMLEVDCRFADFLEVQVTRDSGSASTIDVWWDAQGISRFPLDLALRA